jgi:hypothetical protein
MQKCIINTSLILSICVTLVSCGTGSNNSSPPPANPYAPVIGTWTLANTHATGTYSGDFSTGQTIYVTVSSTGSVSVEDVNHASIHGTYQLIQPQGTSVNFQSTPLPNGEYVIVAIDPKYGFLFDFETAPYPNEAQFLQFPNGNV